MLAQLVANAKEQMVYLNKAYVFHPDSSRTVAALREARSRQLQDSAQALTPRTLTSRRLPDRQSNTHSQAEDESGSEVEDTPGHQTATNTGLRSLLNLL